MDKDIIAVLDALISAERLTLAELEELSSLKKHKINSIVEHINNKSDNFGCQIFVHRGSGYMLVIKDKYLFLTTVNKIRKKVKGHSLPSQVFQIIAYQKEYISSIEIEEEAFVSRPKLSQIIKELNISLVNYNLEIVYKKYYGYKVVGNEEMIRCYLVDRNIFCYRNDDKIQIETEFERLFKKLKQVQTERQEAGFLIDNNIGLEKQYITKMMDIETPPIIDVTIEEDLCNKYLIENGITDDFMCEQFKLRVRQVVYGLHNSNIPLREFRKGTNFFAGRLCLEIISYIPFDVPIRRMVQLSKFLFPMIEFVIDSYYDDYVMDYKRVGILANASRIKVRRAEVMLKNLISDIQIEIIEPKEIGKFKENKYDLAVILDEMSRNEIEFLLPSPIVNVNRGGQMMALSELYTNLYTRKLIDEIRDQVIIVNEHSISDKEILQKAGKWKMYISDDVEHNISLCYEAHELIICTDYFNHKLINQIFILRIFEILANKHSLRPDKVIVSIEDIIGEVRAYS